jgi:exopolysaccharide biosynthesis WecB/TagA/CpsF family protein
MFFLGAADGVAEIARKRINTRLGCNFVVGSYAPPIGFENDPAEVEKARQFIRDSGAGSVAVALGAPKQERWIIENRAHLPNVRCYMGIGGTLSFEAGAVHRSPKWMSDIGMEWAWRLAKEPRRLWRRYLVDDLPFFKLLMRQKMAQGGAAQE